MIFNKKISPKNKYLMLRLSSFSRGILSSLYYSFIKTKRTKTIIFNSACNQEFTWNAKSLFLHGLNIFQSKGFKVYFVIDDDVKRKELNLRYGDYFISSLIPHDRQVIMSASVWVLSTLETPCSGIFLNRNRFVYHLGHGTPIKNIGLMEKNLTLEKKIFYKLNTTNISLFLSSSNNFVDYMSKAFGVKKERICVSPQPRIDDFLVKNENTFFKKKKGYKYVLYAPTWRHYSETKLFPFESFDLKLFQKELEKLKVIILLRVHPRFESESTKFTCNNILSFNSEVCADISEALSFTDALVTDYSSIYCDYLLLNKPVAFLPYDLKEYASEVGFSMDYDRLTTSEKIFTKSDFFKFVSQIDIFDCDLIQKKLCDDLNFVPSWCSATEFNIKKIEEEYHKRWLL